MKDETPTSEKPEAPERVWVDFVNNRAGIGTQVYETRYHDDDIEYARVRTPTVSTDVKEAAERALKAIFNHMDTHAAGEDALEVCTDIIAAEFRGADKRAEWQPIETAPKDGSFVLMAWADGHLQTESSNPQESSFWYENAPTHWMPLPRAPEPVPVAEEEK